MSNTDKKLSELFDLEPIATDTGLAELSKNAIADHTDDEEKRKKYVKDTMVQLIEKGKLALEQLHGVARDSEKSRDYEVLFTGMKTITEIGDKLLDVDSKKPAEQKSDDTKTVQNTQNNIFVGNAADFQKFIRDSVNNNIIDTPTKDE